MATSRDDDSPLPVASYDVPFLEGDTGQLGGRVIFPFDDPAHCSYASDAGLRTSAWADRLRSAHLIETLGWPCGADHLDDYGLLPLGHTDGEGFGFCLTRPIRVGPTGEAECRITAISRHPTDPCASERGWADPMGPDGVRRSVTGTGEVGNFRMCEVQQLGGVSLEECRTTVECDGCGSGWCRTELPYLAERHCLPHVASQLRFVGGSLAGSDARFRLLCELEP
jgi:hypothetical protein